ASASLAVRSYRFPFSSPLAEPQQQIHPRNTTGFAPVTFFCTKGLILLRKISISAPGTANEAVKKVAC
ncbi:hypothetical protein RFN28_34420, partial [Mesorhizobium sp. VK24D]